MQIEQLIKDLENLAKRYPTRNVEIIAKGYRLDVKRVEICPGHCHVLVMTGPQA